MFGNEEKNGTMEKMDKIMKRREEKMKRRRDGFICCLDERKKERKKHESFPPLVWLDKKSEKKEYAFML